MDVFSSRAVSVWYFSAMDVISIGDHFVSASVPDGVGTDPVVGALPRQAARFANTQAGLASSTRTLLSDLFVVIIGLDVCFGGGRVLLVLHCYGTLRLLSFGGSLFWDDAASSS